MDEIITRLKTPEECASFARSLRALASAVKDARDTGAQIISIIADGAVESEIFEKVPIFCALIHAVDFIDATIKAKLVRNVSAFLLAAQSDDPLMASQAFEKVYGDPRFREEIPDTIMQILTDSNKPLKADIIGRMFLAVGSDSLRLEDFDTLCLVVLSASIPALQYLKEFGDHFEAGPLIPHYAYEEFLVSAGVASRGRDGLTLTTFGHKLYVFGFGSKVPTEFIQIGN